jgi:hypothetical protein
MDLSDARSKALELCEKYQPRQPGMAAAIIELVGAYTLAMRQKDSELARRDAMLAAGAGLVEACQIALSTISPKIDNSDAMGWGVSAEAHLDSALAAYRAAEGGAK